MSLPREYISYNQIRLYQNCPRQYYFSYIKEIKTPINDKILLGIIFHSTAEYFLKKKISGSEIQNDDILEYFSENFRKTTSDSEIKWDNSREDTKNRGFSFVKYFLKEIAPELKPLMTEKDLEAKIPGSDTKLKGIIDLVEDDFSLTDFKTTTSKWSKERATKSFLQMYIYKYLFEENLGNVISDLKFRIIYSKNSTNIKQQQFSINARDVDMEKMFEIINFVIENIKRGYFYKNESFICNFCDYKDICNKTSV
ncbi:MAG: PD-(D/E)XK nuclease family protein [Acidobacteriota bacterium]